MDKSDVKGEITKTAESFKKALTSDIDELKTFVMQTTQKVKEDRERL